MRMEVEIRNPATLEEATHVTNLYDTITYNTRNPYQPTYGHQQVNGPPTSNHNHPPSTTTPMDLGAIATPIPGRRLAKLTPAEYEHLKTTGGCFHCRQKGHLAQNCTTYKNQVNALSMTTPENFLPQ